MMIAKWKAALQKRKGSTSPIAFLTLKNVRSLAANRVQRSTPTTMLEKWTTEIP
jgi:hypothetical protein